MPDLNFQIESAGIEPFAATPLLAFRLRVTNAAQEPIHSVALRCQLQIEAPRRRYSAEEQAHLLDLFGEPDRWSQTLRGMLWTHVNLTVPQFAGTTTADLQVPCTFDFNVASTKYFYGLTEGEIPVCFLFSGTVFYADPGGALQVSPISWEKEARFRLPLKVWRELMDAYYPNSAWLCLRRDAFERLAEYKMRHGIPSWEQALERLLAAEEEVVPR